MHRFAESNKNLEAETRTTHASLVSACAMRWMRLTSYFSEQYAIVQMEDKLQRLKQAAV